jgi:hypothetical protein
VHGGTVEIEIEGVAKLVNRMDYEEGDGSEESVTYSSVAHSGRGGLAELTLAAKGVDNMLLYRHLQKVCYLAQITRAISSSNNFCISTRKVQLSTILPILPHKTCVAYLAEYFATTFGTWKQHS